MEDVKNRKKYILIIILLLLLFIILFFSFNFFNKNRLLTGYVGNLDSSQDKDEVKLEPLPVEDLDDTSNKKDETSLDKKEDKEIEEVKTDDVLEENKTSIEVQQVKYYYVKFIYENKEVVQKITYGTKANLKSNEFKKNNATFVSWNTKKDGTGTSYSDNETIYNLSSQDNGVVILYPIFKDDSYTIRLNSNNEDNKVVLVNALLKEDIKTPANPFVNTGFDFVSWNTKKDGSGESYNIDDLLTINAKKDEVVNLYEFGMRKKQHYKVVHLLMLR